MTFEDLWFKVGGNYTALLLWNSSDITCKQVYFEATTPTNSEFFIYMDTHSKLTLEGVGMKVRKNTKVPSVCPLRNCLFAIQRSFLRLICQKDLN